MDTTRNENGSRPARIRRDYHASLLGCWRHESNFWTLREKPPRAKAALEEAGRIAQLNLDKEPEMATIVEEYSRMLKAHGKPKEARNFMGL
jgi:hypothetical protein